MRICLTSGRWWWLCAAFLSACMTLLLPVHAAEVFKCRAADGTISYQDRQCGDQAQRLDAPTLPHTYTPPPITAQPLLDPQPAKAPATAVARVRVEDPLPQMFRCTSPEGGSYVSSDPTPRGRYVPLWTLGIGSTGGLVSGRIDPRYGAQYTYVEDRCRTMPRGELCVWWKQRADETGSERRRAFKDRRALLDQEYAGARDALVRFCS